MALYQMMCWIMTKQWSANCFLLRSSVCPIVTQTTWVRPKIHTGIEEGFIQKRRQRPLLLFEGTDLAQFLAALKIQRQDDLKKCKYRKMNTSLRNGCFGKIDDFPVHTAPKQMFFQNLFFKSSLRHYCIKVRPPNSDLCLLFCVNPYSMLCAFWPALMLWRILNLNASQEAMQICFYSFC